MDGSVVDAVTPVPQPDAFAFDPGPVRPPANVLVTDGGSGQGRSALAAVRALGRAGYQVTATTSGSASLASRSRHCWRALSLPPATSPGYGAELRTELASGFYGAVVAASDAAMLTLNLPGADLVDKDHLAARSTEVGIDPPHSIRCADASEVTTAASELGYPVVIKPVVSTFPAVRVDRPEDLPADDDLAGPVVVQPFLRAGLRSISGVVIESRLAAVVHTRYERTWPVACGTSCAAVTVERDLNMERRLTRLLAGHRGVFQAQLIGDRLIDLNPRVYGSLPLASAADVDLLSLSLDPPPRGEPVRTAKIGVRYRWIEGDLRHVVSQVSERAMSPLTAARALLPRRSVAHSVFSLRDPRPQLERLRYGMANR